MQPSRRQVLLAAGVATAAACTTDKPLRPLPPTLDETLRAAAAAREQSLVDAYVAALREHPGLTSTLAPVLGDHAAHLAALRPDTPSATATATPVTTPLTTRTPRAPARSAAATLAGLAALEHEAATEHSTAAERAETDISCGRVLAPLLASLAACEASHAVVLR